MIVTGDPYPVDLDPDTFAGLASYTVVGEASDGNAWHGFGASPATPASSPAPPTWSPSAAASSTRWPATASGHRLLWRLPAAGRDPEQGVDSGTGPNTARSATPASPAPVRRLSRLGTDRGCC